MENKPPTTGSDKHQHQRSVYETVTVMPYIAEAVSNKKPLLIDGLTGELIGEMNVHVLQPVVVVHPVNSNTTINQQSDKSSS